MTRREAEADAPTHPAAGPAAEPRPRRLVSVAWLAGAMATVTVGYVVVALRNRGFFLVDDTESAIMPMFSHIGHELRAGNWPGVSERNWTVGLVAGDPQYAMFNPLSLLSYWAVDPVGSLVWRLFLIVLLWLNLLTAGVFLAARALGSSPPFAALAAVIAGLNLFVLYWQAAGWTSILPGVAWFAIAVAALLAALQRLDRPWRAVVAGLAVTMLMTSGSPFALQAFVPTVAILLGATVLGRRRVALRRVGLVVAAGLAGAVLGAVPWVVSLHYVGHTRRQGGAYNNGFLTFHLESLLMSFTPAVRPFTGSFRGWGSLDQPVTYGSWLFAGAVAVIVLRRVALRPLEVAVAVAGVVVYAMTFGPEHAGPFRWPFRLVPFAMILLAVATAVVLERAMRAPARDGRDRRPLLLVAVAAAAGLTLLLHASVVAALVTAAVVAAGIPFVAWCAHAGRPLALVGTGIATTLAVWVAVVLLHPRTTDLIDLGGPGHVATARADLEPLRGHRTLQLLTGIPDFDIRAVLANNYSLYGTEPAEVINGYTSLVPAALGDMLCVSDNGYVCPDGPARIFRHDPETGLRYVDLLGVSQIMVQKGPLLDTFERSRSPEWQSTGEIGAWVMYGNGTALGADPVVWTSEGVTVTRVGGRDHLSVPAGGRIVLSRPQWPGTSVTVGGVEADLDAVAGVFVGATFDRAVEGDLVVGHAVPGRRAAQLTAALGATMLAACAAVAARMGRRRGRRPGPAPGGS